MKYTSVLENSKLKLSENFAIIFEVGNIVRIRKNGNPYMIDIVGDNTLVIRNFYTGKTKVISRHDLISQMMKAND
jgi:hypothetical protein